jgi:undecaprenyl-diphosphatase
MTAFDHTLMEWIQALGGRDGSVWQKIMDFFFCSITFMGEETFLLLGIFIVYWGVNKKFGEYLVISLFATIGLNGFFKGIFQRPRPFLKPEFNDLRHVQVDNFFVSTTNLAHSYSFPSGHSQLAGSLFTTTALYFKKRWLYILMGSLIVLMMMSRVYLGVHYPSDVLVGGVLGVAVAVIMFKLLQKYSDKKIIILLVLFGLVIVTLIIELATGATSAPDTAKMAGLAAGAISGFLYEGKKINFKVDGVWWKRTLRVIIGFALVMGVRLGLKPLFGIIADEGTAVGYILDALRYLCIGVTATALWPLIFKKVNL